MSAEPKHIRELIEKLEALPPERLAEVEDFIDFIKHREQTRQLTRDASAASEHSFDRVWDNPDDAVYDKL